ncbi:hypothetical protein IFR05_005377 [Cadophora sp. M221]|nr:hypothetical protein IFR05_005377 [Cadophora sp. M221]
MKLLLTALWLVACAGIVFGIPSKNTAPNIDVAGAELRTVRSSHMFASSHTIAQRQPSSIHAAPHMYASSHTLAQRQVAASLVLGTSISLFTTVVNGTTAVILTNIIIALAPKIPLPTIPRNSVGEILQGAAITTITSIPELSTTTATTKLTPSPVLILTSTVEDVVTVTAIIPSVSTGKADPESQIQGTTKSGPSISFVPGDSTTRKATPTSTTKPHTVPSAGEYTYFGCYSEGLVARALGEAFFPSDENTIERCASACYPYKYAGAEYGRECWCGNVLKGATKASDSDFCIMPCAGNQQQYCGGIVALNVYIRATPDSSSLVPMTGSPTRSLKTSSPVSKSSIPSSPQTSQAITLFTSSSSAASTGPAITTSSITLSKTSSANSDSQLLTVTLVSSLATSSSKVTTTIVTSAKAAPVSGIVDNGTTTSKPFTTQIGSFTMPSSTLSTSSATISQTLTSSVLPSPPKEPTSLPSPTNPAAPSALYPTTKKRLTSSITLQLALSSRMMRSFFETVTDIHTVTQKHSYTSLPVYTVYSSSESSTSTSNSPASSETFTMTSAIPTPDPPFSSGTPPELTGGMWTLPPVFVTPDVPELSSLSSDVATPSPSSVQTGLDAPASSASSNKTTTQPAYTLSNPITPSGIFNHTTTSHKPAYTYGTSKSASKSIVTVTSFLIPTPLKPSSSVSITQGLGLQAVMFLAGLWVLIYVVWVLTSRSGLDF